MVKLSHHKRVMKKKHNQTVQKSNSKEKGQLSNWSSLRRHGLLALACGCGVTAGAWDLNLGTNQTVSFHGFGSQGFLYSSDYNYFGNTTDGSFQYTEMGLNASYSPFKRTRIAVQGFAFDMGDVGNLEPFLDYALVEYTFNDKIGVRGGRIRRPGGIYNHIQDLDMARTSVLLPQGMYDARWRDFSTSMDGGELFGNLSLAKAGSLSYELFGGMMNLSEEGGVARWIVNGKNVKLHEFEQPLVVGGQLWWNTPVNGLRAGVMLAQFFDFGYKLSSPMGAGPFGPLAAKIDSSGDIFMQQYSLEYVWNSWTFQAEYFTYDFSYDQNQRVYSGNVPLPAFSSSSKGARAPDCWYAGAAKRFNSWLEVGTYYTEFYQDVHNRSGNSDASQRDLALSVRFDPTDWWILKVEGHYIRGTSLLQNDARNANRDDDGWFMLALKSTFSF